MRSNQYSLNRNPAKNDALTGLKCERPGTVFNCILLLIWLRALYLYVTYWRLYCAYGKHTVHMVRWCTNWVLYCVQTVRRPAGVRVGSRGSTYTPERAAPSMSSKSSWNWRQLKLHLFLYITDNKRNEVRMFSYLVIHTTITYSRL